MDAYNYWLDKAGTYRNNSTFPLWDLRKHEKKYMEFQLFAANIDDFNNNDWLTELNHNVFTCHICDVNVPHQYTKQHFSSSKHKAFKTIIEICLDRVKRQINNDTIESNTVKHTNVHFCDHCSVAVTENDKIIHSLSEDHSINAAKDEILIEFEKILLNKKEFIFKDVIFIKKQKTQSEVDNNVSVINNDDNVDTSATEKATDADHSIIDTLSSKNNEKHVTVAEMLSFTLNGKDTKANHSIKANEVTIPKLSTTKNKEHVAAVSPLTSNEKDTEANNSIEENDATIETLPPTKNEKHVTVGEVSSPTSNEKDTKAKHSIKVADVTITTLSAAKYEKHVTEVTSPTSDEKENEANLSIKENILSITKLTSTKNEKNVIVAELSSSTTYEKDNKTHSIVENDVKIAKLPIPKNEKHVAEVSSITSNGKCTEADHSIKENSLTIAKLSPTKNEKIVAEVSSPTLNKKDTNAYHSVQKNDITIAKLSPTKYEEQVAEVSSLNTNEKGTEVNNSNQENNVRTARVTLTKNKKHVAKVSQQHVKDTETDNNKEKMPDSEYEARYIRKVDGLYHCSLCVTNMTNAAEHINGGTHKANIKVVDDTFKKVRRKCTKVYCEICELSFIRKKFEKHLQSDEHLRNEKTKKRIELEPVTDIYLFDHFNLQDFGKNLFCKFCKVSLPNSFSSSLIHLQSAEHIEISNTVLSNNHIRLSETGKYFCESCNIYILRGFEYVHITNQFHRDKMEPKKTSNDSERLVILKKVEFIPNTTMLQPRMKIGPNLLTNAICYEENTQSKDKNDKVSIYNTKSPTNISLQPNSIKTDENELNEDSKLTSEIHTLTNSKEQKDENIQINLPKENEKKSVQWVSLEYLCDVCEIKIPYDSESKEAHKQSDEHRLNLSKHVILNSAIAESLYKKLHYVYEKTENDKIYNCLICTEEVDSADFEIRQHIDSKKHISSYNNILANNAIQVNDNNIYCEVCDIAIDITNEITHIKTPEHISKLKRAKSKAKVNNYYCKLCDITIPNNNESIDNHINNKTHQRRTPKNEKLIARGLVNHDTIKPELQICYKNKPQLLCVICQETMQQSDIFPHLNTNEHLKNLRDAFAFNKMKYKVNHFECGPCDRYISIDYAVAHLDTVNHKKNLFLYEPNDNDS